jgi:hypothetical protein
LFVSAFSLNAKSRSKSAANTYTHADFYIHFGSSSSHLYSTDSNQYAGPRAD